MLKLSVIPLLFSFNLVHAEINITDLKNGEVLNWGTEQFSGETEYEIITLDDKPVLKAVSEKAASALFLEKKIDLKKTPYMNWSWLVKQGLPELDEKKKKGDDHAARIYIVFKDGPFIWNTKSINYVWSGSQSAGEIWNNPFAGSNVKMLAIQGKDSQLNRWYSEKRNIYKDLQEQFGKKHNEADTFRYIDGIAIMTDSDNSKASAKAYYGDIVFTSD